MKSMIRPVEKQMRAIYQYPAWKFPGKNDDALHTKAPLKAK